MNILVVFYALATDVAVFHCSKKCITLMSKAHFKITVFSKTTRDLQHFAPFAEKTRFMGEKRKKKKKSTHPPTIWKTAFRNACPICSHVNSDKRIVTRVFKEF